MSRPGCVWVNPWKDSGDRGAAQCDHDRECHPDHQHTFGVSPYDWEQVGVDHIAPGDRTRVTPRTHPVMRCTVCRLRDTDQRVCGP